MKLQPYDVASYMNAARSNRGTPVGGVYTYRPLTVNGGYAQPNRWQQGRTIRLGVRFTF